MGIGTRGVFGGRGATAPPLPIDEGADPGRLLLASPGGAAICVLSRAGGAADSDPATLLQRLLRLPAAQAAEGVALARDRVYRQDAQHAFGIGGGRFRAAARAPRLTEQHESLLARAEELAQGASDVKKAAQQLMECVEAGLGWRAIGYRLFGLLAPPPFAEASSTRFSGENGRFADPAGSPHEAGSDRSQTVLLIEPVCHQEQLLAALIFALPRAELDHATSRLLQRVAALLAGVAARNLAGEHRLHHHIETARRLTGMADVAHSLASELSQPLAAAMNYAGALRRTVGRGDRSAADAERLIEKLEGQVRRAGAILHGIDDSAGQRGCPLQVVQVDAPVRKVLSLLDGELRVHGVMLRCDVEDGLPPVRANAVYLEQILLCVIDHALAPEGATVRRDLSLRAHRAGADVRVSISGGIPTPVDSLGDDAVALTTARVLAEAQGGRLWVEEDAGKLNFVLALPVIE